MIYEKHLFKILFAPHVSEKTSIIVDKYNTVVLKVMKKTTKIEIKKAVEQLFKVNVKHVNTLIIKGKVKRKANRIIYGSNWKKAYVILEKGQNVNFLDK